MPDYPPIQPNGSLMIAWQVKDKPVLVIGGGEVPLLQLLSHTYHIYQLTNKPQKKVAASRIVHLLNASALITVLCPPSGLSPEVQHRLSTHPSRITHIPRPFDPSDLDSTPAPSLVLSAIDDPAVSTQIWQECKKRKIPANIADVPSECDFYFGAVHRSGPVQVMVSTNGKGPRMAGLLRDRIAGCLPGNAGEAVENVGVLRGMLRVRAPGVEEGKRRMRWISRVCERWSLEELGSLEEGDMDVLLGYYGRDEVPGLEEVRGKK